MNTIVYPIKLPVQLEKYLQEIISFFPEKVRFDEETRGAVFTADLSREVRITLSYVSFISEFTDVTECLDVILLDLNKLAEQPPHSAKEGEIRYFFLTRAFFYELLRIKDAFPRFLKRAEQDGIMTRDQRLSSKKKIEDWMHEHYLIRNTYLHGHTMPKNNHEQDLSLLASVSNMGYQPELVPLDGSEKKIYPEFLIILAQKRYALLLDLANDYVRLFQSILDTTAIWLDHHQFKQVKAET